MRKVVPAPGWLSQVTVPPWAVAPVVTGFFWQFIFESRIGIINGVLIGSGVSSHPIPWLETTGTAVGVAVIATAWRSVPLLAVLLLATIGLTFIGLLSVAGFTVMAQRRMRALGMIGAIGATDRQVRQAEILARQQVEKSDVEREQVMEAARIERRRAIEQLEIARVQALQEAEIASREEVERSRIASSNRVTDAMSTSFPRTRSLKWLPLRQAASSTSARTLVRARPSKPPTKSRSGKSRSHMCAAINARRSSGRYQCADVGASVRHFDQAGSLAARRAPLKVKVTCGLNAL